MERAVGIAQDRAAHLISFHGAADARGEWLSPTSNWFSTRIKNRLNHNLSPALRSKAEASRRCGAGKQGLILNGERIFQGKHASEKHNRNIPALRITPQHGADLLRMCVPLVEPLSVRDTTFA